MKLEEAIANLKADLLRPGSVDKLDFQDTEQLGIEALKGIIAVRQLHPELSPFLLPGETTD